jgi:hypothetical protein
MTVDDALASVVDASVATIIVELRELRAEVAALRAVAPSPWVSVAGAAELLSVSPQTIAAMATRGEIVGWNSYQSEPPSPTAVTNAKAALEQLALLGLRPDKIAASAQDGIIIYMTDGSRYSDVECYNTGEIVVTKREEGTEATVWEVQPGKELYLSLSDIRNFLTDG